MYCMNHSHEQKRTIRNSKKNGKPLMSGGIAENYYVSFGLRGKSRDTWFISPVINNGKNKYKNNYNNNSAIGAFGTVTKGLLKGLEDLEVGGRAKTIQTTALLRTARILRRVLETWEDLLSLILQWKNIG